jgi:DNA replication protein DnaC
MAGNLEERVQYAQNNKLGYQELLSLLCEDERNVRRDNNYKRRYNAAKLPSRKKLEEFDFSFQPSINSKTISDMATCGYIANKENILLIGSSGTGKTHLAIGLAHKALERDYTVYFTTVSDMLYQLHIARADNSYYKKLKQLISYDLLILDELGFKEIPKYSAEDFYNVISKKYENKSMIITTNKSLDSWQDIFGDEILTRAIVDRMMHYSHTFNINGKSYRMKKTMIKEVNMV